MEDEKSATSSREPPRTRRVGAVKVIAVQLRGYMEQSKHIRVTVKPSETQ